MGRRMASKFPGKCKCGARFNPGAEIEWDKRAGITGCTVCGFTGEGGEQAEQAPRVTDAERASNLAALRAKLNAEQSQVAGWLPEAGNLRVVAAAGSGKTTTTVALLANLLDAGIPASKLVATTFTNKAGMELQERLDRVVSESRLAGALVGTFHSIALQALRKADAARWSMDRCVDVAGRSREIPAASTLWSRAVESNPIQVLGGERGLGLGEGADREYPLAAEACARSKGLRAGTAEAREACAASELPSLHEAWSLYERQKAAHGAWDFGDALVAYYDLVRAGPGGKVVIVDEAQDNSLLQIAIAQALSANGGRLVLVGDVRQSIYEWRGAAPALFLAADEAIGAKTLFLLTNYRSGKEIVEIGNRIAEGREWSLGPACNAGRDFSGTVTVTGYFNAEEEAYEVAREIAAAIEAKIPANEIAVLCRTRAQQGLYEAELLSRRVPVAVVGGSSFFGAREWRDFAALAALVNGGATPDDMRRAVRLQPGCGFFAADAAANALNRGVQGALAAAVADARAAKTREALHSLARFILELQGKTFRVQCEAVAERLCALVGHEEGEEDTRGGYTASAAIAARFDDLPHARAFAGRCEGAAITLRDDDRTGGEGRVCISTIHKAKGREWTVVHCSASAGTFPHARCEGNERRMQEEARLFYVAVTRAARRLHLSFTAVNGRGKPAGPSEFLSFAETPAPVDPGPQGGGEQAPAEALVEAPAAAQEALPAPAAVEAQPEAQNAPAATPEAFREALAADLPRAEALTAGGAVPAEGQRFVPVALTEMLELLAPHGFREDRDATKRANQIVLVASVGLNTTARVYTSIPAGDDVARGLGEDSIKVAVMGPQGRPVSKRQPYAARTRGWRVTLLKRLLEASAVLGGPCGKCGGLTVERVAKAGGRVFHGCASYPACDGFGVTPAQHAADASVSA